MSRTKVVKTLFNVRLETKEVVQLPRWFIDNDGTQSPYPVRIRRHKVRRIIATDMWPFK